MRRKWTRAELDELIETAKQVMAGECQSWHPVINKRCQLAVGHQEPHRWRYNKWSKVWRW